MYASGMRRNSPGRVVVSLSSPAPLGSSRERDLDATLDYLVIDEANRISLANALAMGTSARNVISARARAGVSAGHDWALCYLRSTRSSRSPRSLSENFSPLWLKTLV